MLSFSNNSSRTQRSERRTAANRSARALLTGTVTLGSLAVTLALPSVAQSESLWDRHIPEKSYLFYDTKARYVGDRVTIVVTQSTGVDNREDRGMDKSTSASGILDFASAAGGGFGTQGAEAGLDFSATSNRKFEGGANYSANQAFNDRVTATVMDVLPNGSMVISASRTVRVAGEERTLVLTGVIRGLDIGPDNTINSRYISDLQLVYESSGPSQKFTRQGWLGRVTNKIWPF